MCRTAGIIFFALTLVSPGEVTVQTQENSAVRLLARLHAEVREFGKRPGEDFIRQDFFIGGEDDDDTNKDIHVGILIRAEGDGESMAIQVTWLERSKADPRVKNARETKTLTCRVRPDGVRVLNSDFPPDRLERLAKDILKAVIAKKRLMKR
jgi:hypothetical protein